MKDKAIREKRLKDAERKRQSRQKVKTSDVDHNTHEDIKFLHNNIESILKSPSRKQFLKKLNPERYGSPKIKRKLMDDIRRLQILKVKRQTEKFVTLSNRLMENNDGYQQSRRNTFKISFGATTYLLICLI